MGHRGFLERLEQGIRRPVKGLRGTIDSMRGHGRGKAGTGAKAAVGRSKPVERKPKGSRAVAEQFGAAATAPRIPTPTEHATRRVPLRSAVRLQSGETIYSVSVEKLEDQLANGTMVVLRPRKPLVAQEAVRDILRESKAAKPESVAIVVRVSEATALATDVSGAAQHFLKVGWTVSTDGRSVWGRPADAARFSPPRGADR